MSDELEGFGEEEYDKYNPAHFIEGMAWGAHTVRFGSDEMKQAFLSNVYEVAVRCYEAICLVEDRDPKDVIETFAQSAPDGAQWQEIKHAALAAFQPYVGDVLDNLYEIMEEEQDSDDDDNPAV